MLKKRVIFTLLYDNGSFMLSRNFRLQKVGTIQWLKKNYDFSQVSFSIDELIIMDVSRGTRNEKKFSEHVTALTEKCFVPIAAGGGVQTVEQSRRLLRTGADKVVVNTLVAINPKVITAMASEFGNQCIVVAVDIKQAGKGFEVWTHNGAVLQKLAVTEWLKRIVDLPVGEIYLNSMDRDGTGQGYLMELLDLLPKHMPIPVILSGGAGKYHHLAEGMEDSRVDAVATAHLFNFVGDGLRKARQGLLDSAFNLAVWDIQATETLQGILEMK